MSAAYEGTVEETSQSEQEEHDHEPGERCGADTTRKETIEMNNNEPLNIREETIEMNNEDENMQPSLEETDDELTTAEIEVLLGHATAKDKEFLDRDWAKPGDREWLRTLIPQIEGLQRDWPYIREEGYGREYLRRKLPTMWQGFGYYVYEISETTKYMDEYMEAAKPVDLEVPPDFREGSQTGVPRPPAGL